MVAMLLLMLLVLVLVLVQLRDGDVALRLSARHE